MTKKEQLVWFDSTGEISSGEKPFRRRIIAIAEARSLLGEAIRLRKNWSIDDLPVSAWLRATPSKRRFSIVIGGFRGDLRLIRNVRLVKKDICLYAHVPSIVKKSFGKWEDVAEFEDEDGNRLYVRLIYIAKYSGAKPYIVSE
ncbi:MAG: hypothetical protein WC242_00355 [Candidatus Paceibacterota bacterium]|jgi:hypothetical protein